MSKKPLISLCIPTNGVVQWVFPVLESVYSQGVDNSLFEVVITDNGDNLDFKEMIQDYLKSHLNIVYAETKALPFINEIEAYKMASGELIKFVNHRTLLVKGALQRLVDYARDNLSDKPVTYFANGVLKKNKNVYDYDNFNDFVKNLSYWSSWSTGMTIWRTDFDKLPKNLSDFNELFPHTNVLFNERNRGSYVIDNTVIFDEMPQGKKPKGNYDLYFAFGVEYPKIIEGLLNEGSINRDVYRFILDKNLEFIASLYWEYNVKKKYCSYDLNGLDDMYGKFYFPNQLQVKVLKYGCKQIIKKMIRRK